MTYNKPTIVELFSGPGGLALGFHLAGFETLVAYEFEEDSINTYKANFPNTNVIKKDLANFSDDDISELREYVYKKTEQYSVDIVMGGPPCRSFSTSNPKRTHGDKRDYYYKQLIRVASELNAKYFIMENVDDILSKSISKTSQKKVFHCLLEDLQNEGFLYINFKILKAADYGTPQTRERIFILATKDSSLPLTYPEPTHSEHGTTLPRWVTVEEAFEDLPKVTSVKDTKVGEDQFLVKNSKTNNSGFYFCDTYKKKPSGAFSKYCRNIENSIYDYRKFTWVNFKKDILTLFNIPNHSNRIIERYNLLQEDENQGDLVTRLRNELSTDEFQQLLDKKIIPKGVFIQKNRKLPANIPSRTVTSHAREELVHPNFNRNLTAREVARLQGFPDWYIFTGANQKPHKPDSEKEIGTGRDYYQQIGDAVPPLMSAALAKEILNNLSNMRDATYAPLRENIIKYIYSNNLKLTDLKQKLKIDAVGLADILSGIIEPKNQNLLYNEVEITEKKEQPAKQVALI
ncbi:hypothetical protein BC351_30105 [Paenibacillus ferrarius]|uniref:Cytosine-specific methyltransferase n=1 Tax=Paenibacillus ferrarius TaxID=1469647 RepID=A0A1V4HGW2_9BACL|nr:DNA cytosine methyltransferase [Paenibacillus ferrarius]OPH54976.1 hypothetical protein BC351_30105 [Paenibacillus ferrarius]